MNRVEPYTIVSHKTPEEVLKNIVEKEALLVQPVKVGTQLCRKNEGWLGEMVRWK